MRIYSKVYILRKTEPEHSWPNFMDNVWYGNDLKNGDAFLVFVRVIYLK